MKLLRQARAAGCRISIGTDAHHPHQLGFIEPGLAAALLAKVPAERVVNFLARDQLLAWVASVRDALHARPASKSTTPRTGGGVMARYGVRSPS